MHINSLFYRNAYLMTTIALFAAYFILSAALAQAQSRVHCRDPVANACDRMYGSERECESNCAIDVKKGYCGEEKDCTKKTEPTPSGILSISNPIQAKTFGELVQAIAKAITAIGIPLVAIFLVWSGFLFVTARGNEEQLKRAKTTFFWAVVGGAVVIGAWAIAIAIVNFAKSLG